MPHTQWASERLFRALPWRQIDLGRMRAIATAGRQRCCCSTGQRRTPKLSQKISRSATTGDNMVDSDAMPCRVQLTNFSSLTIWVLRVCERVRMSTRRATAIVPGPSVAHADDYLSAVDSDCDSADWAFDGMAGSASRGHDTQSESQAVQHDALHNAPALKGPRSQVSQSTRLPGKPRA